jgi:tRNA (guanine37-N1)-methyltransferase
MIRESFGLKVPKARGETALTIANKLGLIDKDLQIQHEADWLCIPLLRQPSETEKAVLAEQVPDFKFAKQAFVEKKTREKTLVEALADALPSSLVAGIPHSLDVVGDIAIIEIPLELKLHKAMIGEAILSTHRKVRVALAKAGKVSGTFRLRELEFIAGEHRTSTVYRENGCTYHLDVAKAYFSPRLSHEHQRVAEIVQPGETVVDLFAGVGPFAVPIAKAQKTAKVYAIDINANAIEFLAKNARTNRVENRVFPIVGDARQVVAEGLSGVADRVIMNLPETALEFVDVACKALKPSGGVVHFYGFVRTPKTLGDMEQQFSEAAKKSGRKVVQFRNAKAVRETAPYECQAVLDAEIL